MPVRFNPRLFATGALLAGLFLSAAAVGAANPQDPYRPLWLYQGAWEFQSHGKTDHLVNDCKMVGKYFLCQQTVNGKISSLIVFLPAEAAGHYHTQGVNAEGFALGRGDLEINGDHWIYDSKAVENGRTTYYRTTNQFTGKNKIHYEMSESSDGRHWKVTGSGDEFRVTKK